MRSSHSVLAGLALSASLLLAACSTMPSGGVVTPNANLLVQGIPPISQSMVASVEKYTDFRGHGFVAWHPTRKEMLVSHRAPGASVNQVFRLASPMGALEPLTEGPEPASQASYEPTEGQYIVFSRASGGR